MTVISLSGSDWVCGAAAADTGEDDCLNVKEWLPAEVSGQVQLAILAAGRITDDRIESVQQSRLRLIVDKSVVYRRELDLPADSSQLIDKTEVRVGSTLEIEVDLDSEEAIISHNRCDLGYFNPLGMSRWDEIKHWLAWRTLG